MSESRSETKGASPQERGEAAGTTHAESAGGPGGPRPEPLRFFGTTWVAHDGGYAARRAAVAVGSLAVAAGACLLLRFAYQGLTIADASPFVGGLVVVMFAVCSAIAFRKTWEGFSRRPVDRAREEALRSLKGIGFIGSLLAYFVRSLTEAPGERLRRTEYETAVGQYERRRTTRTGNPAARDKSRTRRPRR
ncbi:hypothetical protein OG875_12705 [Streptomyces sp. NBC_01498]|uniref:hypothetical protein n=1 Tax=Streptomyces sp. NBC_01498 TaxID=2975870 RepID=UPI002E7B6882|nr:hypothetical protein [Streptomyces sp. NBC_01498]WTL25374.1 hypothetical protein OG875_12705 [Streptomyces sp. NBC_01498]